MLDEVFESLLSPLGLGLLAIFMVGTQTGRRLLRRGAKEALKAGYIVSERACDMVTEFSEEAADMLEEAREEIDSRKLETGKARRIKAAS